MKTSHHPVIGMSPRCDLGLAFEAGNLVELSMKHFVAFFLAFAWAAPAFADFEAAAEYSAGLRGISLLIIEDGEVVYESYPSGGAEDRAQPLASGTKSFMGILAAAAVQDGLLDLDELASDTITEWQGSQRETITVRQLLSQTSGLRNPRQVSQIPPYDVAIQLGLQSYPGVAFSYGPVPFQVFGELMRRKLDGDPLEYLTERVLDPIGLEVAFWRRDRSGNPTMSAGARLTARDWARFGEFILARGEWNGEPLVSPEAFEELFVGTAANPAYGLSWWLIEPVDLEFAFNTPPLNNSTDFWHHPDVFPEDMVMAAGAGDQRLYVSWERNIVVVRQAEGIMGALLGRRLSWSDVQFWRLMDAEPGVIPDPLPPAILQRGVEGPRGATVTLPSGGMVQLPPVADPDEEEDDGDEVADDDAEDDEEEFVGPTF